MLLPYLCKEDLRHVLSFIHCRQWNKVGHLGEAVYYDPDLGVSVRLRESHYKVHRYRSPWSIWHLQRQQLAVLLMACCLVPLATVTTADIFLNVLIHVGPVEVRLDLVSGLNCSKWPAVLLSWFWEK